MENEKYQKKWSLSLDSNTTEVNGFLLISSVPTTAVIGRTSNDQNIVGEKLTEQEFDELVDQLKKKYFSGDSVESLIYGGKI